MFECFIKSILKIYHDFIGLFFDFDVGVYAYQTSKIPVNKISQFKCSKPIKSHSFDIPKFGITSYKFRKPKVVTHSSPSLKSLLVLRNHNREFYNAIKLREEQLGFLSITKNYGLNLKDNLSISSESFVLQAKSHKSLKKEIQISRKLKTVEELLELEPYTHSVKRKELVKIPVVKYPIKKEKFTELQLESMKTKLAIQAKCKKFSMTLENVYDKIPQGLYSEIELNKDSTINCKFEENPKVGELQFLAVGKRKYDTQQTKAMIKYSDLHFNP